MVLLQLVNAAARLVDFVILDCSSNMTNVFTPAAIESGDLVIRILTPDLKGVNYLKAHQPLLGDGRFHYDQHTPFQAYFHFPKQTPSSPISTTRPSS